MLNRAGSILHPQTLIVLAGITALELCFLALHRLGDLRTHVITAIAIALGAGVIYFVLLYALEHSCERSAALWLILAGAILFRLTLAPLAPTLSTDVYRYRWDGHIQFAGWNPYAVKPNDRRLSSLRSPGEPEGPGHDIPSIYPPLAELIFRVTYRFLPDPVAFKLPFIAADLLVVFLLAGWLGATRGRNFQLAIYAWNPLVVVEFAGSGHSDALALAAVVAACLQIIRGRKMLSTLLLGAGALLKSFPIMLFPIWLRRAGWPRSIQSWLNAAAAAALAVLCAWPYRSALAQLPDTMAYYASRWHDNNASVYSVVVWFTGSPELAQGLGVGVAAGVALWAAARRLDLSRAAYLIFGAILILTPNAYSWYFTWIIPFLCFFPNPAWLLLTVLQFLSYHVLIDYQILGIWHWNREMLILTYAPFYALLLWQQFRRLATEAQRH